MKKRIIVPIFIFISVVCSPSGTLAQQTEGLKQLVARVTGGDGTNEEKTRKLVVWVNTNFTWSYTDYQKRTVEEIIARRSGNCAELANVLAALLKEGGIPFRWVAEINIEPQRQSRQETAAKMVAERGKQYSVFGFMHNDHVWLEVRNEKDNSWFPADPAVGVVGLKDWLKARMAFDQRTTPVVPEVAEVVKDMLVPFVVVAKETRGGQPVENRSVYYLIQGFNDLYGKRLTNLHAWKGWKHAVENIAGLGQAAFRGDDNLHEHQKQIEDVWRSYEKLKEEALKKNISL